MRDMYSRLVKTGLVLIGGVLGSELNADQFSDPIEKEQTVFHRFETERFDQEPILSPDGGQIAFIHVQGRDIFRRRLWIMDRDGGNARPLTNDPEPHFEAYPRWSPDGRYIAYTSNLGGDTHVWIISPEGGEPVRITDRHLGQTFGVLSDWSPGSRSLVVNTISSQPNQLLSFQVGGGEPDTLFSSGEIFWPTWSPDGGTILFASIAHEKGNIWTMPASGGKPEAFDTNGEVVWYLDWSPDGNWIVVQTQGPHIAIVSASGGIPIQVTDSDMVSAARTAAWSFDSRELIYSAHPLIPGFQDQLAIMDTSGGNFRSLTQLSEEAGIQLSNAFGQRPFWSPDETHIAFTRMGADTSVCVVEVASGTQRVVASGFGQAWSPDGEEIAFARDKMLWSVPWTGGEPMPITLAMLNHPVELDWSSDGEWISFQLNNQLWRVSAYGGTPERILEFPSFWPHWSGDSSRIYFVNPGSNSNQNSWGDLWHVTPDDPGSATFLDETQGFQFDISDDGNFTVEAYFNAGLVMRRRDLGSDKLIPAPKDGMALSSPVISPSGGRVAFYVVQEFSTHTWTADLNNLINNLDGLP